ncbi:MAG TPA: hypothetical protein VLU25_17495 [Acidobacteriota bacterium]|nr:hypothetical protein [Acidobacteriota bacterium]
MFRRIIAVIALSLMLAVGVTAVLAVNTMDATATSFSNFGCEDLRFCGGALSCNGYGFADGCHITCNSGWDFHCLEF